MYVMRRALPRDRLGLLLPNRSAYESDACPQVRD
jgi:hypothetical protein